MRGPELVLLLFILVGCNWWQSNGAKHGRRHMYKNLTNDMDMLKSQYHDLIDQVKSLRKKVKKMEKGHCQRLECPTGYVQHSTSCFRFVMGQDNAQTWQNARRSCEGIGANLVTINSRKKESFIANFVKNNFASRQPVDLYTGLICTNSEARSPYIMQPGLGGGSFDSVRWTATKEAVNVGAHTVSPPHASWSPAKIEGEPEGPGLVSQSCVIIRWTPEHKKGLIWRYHVCNDVQLGYVCEIRLKRPRCKRKKKKSSVLKRLSKRKPFFDDKEKARVKNSKDSE